MQFRPFAKLSQYCFKLSAFGYLPDIPTTAILSSGRVSFSFAALPCRSFFLRTGYEVRVDAELRVGMDDATDCAVGVSIDRAGGASVKLGTFLISSSRKSANSFTVGYSKSLTLDSSVPNALLIAIDISTPRRESSPKSPKGLSTSIVDGSIRST